VRNKLNLKTFVKEFLRYVLQGEYSGPSIEKLREEMQSIDPIPQATLVIFADTMKYLKNRKYHDKYSCSDANG